MGIIIEAEDAQLKGGGEAGDSSRVARTAKSVVLSSIHHSGGKRLPSFGLSTQPSSNPEGDTRTEDRIPFKGGRKGTMAIQAFARVITCPPTPSPSPLMTQNINIQRQEGEAEQSPIQQQDLCWGAGG